MNKNLSGRDENETIILDYPLSTFRLLVMVISMFMYLFLFVAWGIGAGEAWVNEEALGLTLCLAFLAVACLVGIYNFGRVFLSFLRDPIHLTVTITADLMIIESVHGKFASPIDQIDSFGSSSGRLRIYGLSDSRWRRNRLLCTYNTAGYRTSGRRLAKKLSQLLE